MRILIIKTTSLGDVVHNLPIIADIKKHFPTALIDWVVEESFSEILSMHPGINLIIPVAIRRWRKSLFTNKTWHEIALFSHKLKSVTYDMVIDTQGLLKSGLICYLTNGLNKCGYDWQSAREPVARFFYHHQFSVSRQLHAVERNRQLTASALGYKIDENTLNYGIQKTPNNAGINGTFSLPATFILALHGTSRDSKLWPLENWIALGKLLHLQNMHLVLPWGSAAELQRAKEIAGKLDSAVVLDKSSIGTLAYIIHQAHAVVGVDTGLAHLAVALKKPVIAIYTDTNPILTGLHGNNEQFFKNLGRQDKTTTAEDVMVELKKINIVQDA